MSTCYHHRWLAEDRLQLSADLRTDRSCRPFDNIYKLQRQEQQNQSRKQSVDMKDQPLLKTFDVVTYMFIADNNLIVKLTTTSTQLLCELFDLVSLYWCSNNHQQSLYVESSTVVFYMTTSSTKTCAPKHGSKLNANSINIFKNRLDIHWCMQDIMLCMTLSLSQPEVETAVSSNNVN